MFHNEDRIDPQPITKEQALRMAYAMLRTIEQGGNFGILTWDNAMQQMAGALDGLVTTIPWSGDHQRAIAAEMGFKQ